MTGKRNKTLTLILCGLVFLLNVALDFAHERSHRVVQHSEQAPINPDNGQFHALSCLACCLVITHVAPQPISSTFDPDENSFRCTRQDAIVPTIVLSPSCQLRAPPAPLS